jgi:hypothetical protein
VAGETSSDSAPHYTTSLIRIHFLLTRHLTKPDEAVSVLGMNAFRDTKLNLVRAYLDCDWGMKTVAFAGVSFPPLPR